MSKGKYLEYKKILRIKDNRIFYILDEEFLCDDKMRVLKTISAIKDFTKRFRYFVIGIDN